MTSTIVPPVDLAPGMPSRVVTISATDITEGGQSLAGQKVHFALSDSLDVTSGGDVIAKTSATVVLDSNGDGRIRLPVYDADVRTWCGKEWAVLVSASWGSQKAVRVPAGTSTIALSALPNIRPLRGRELQWAVTGAGITVVEGAQWGASVELDGGVLQFVLTVPPGGVAYSRGALYGGSELNSLETGVYWVATSAAAESLGLPVISQGPLYMNSPDTASTLSSAMFIARTATPRIYTNMKLSTGAWSGWTQTATDEGTRTAAFSLNHPRGMDSESGRNRQYRIPFKLGAKATLKRVAFRNYDYNSDTPGVGQVDLRGGGVGDHRMNPDGSMTGLFVEGSTVQRIASQQIAPADHGVFYGDDVNIELEPHKEYLLSYAYAADESMTVRRQLGQCFGSTQLGAWNNTGTTTATPQSYMGLHVWIELEVDKSTPVWAYVGDSQLSGLSTARPAYDSWARVHAYNNGAIPQILAHPGGSLAEFLDPNKRALRKWDHLDKADRVYIAGLGSNDITNGRPFTGLQDYFATVAQNLREKFSPNLYATTTVPRVEASNSDAVRDAYNDWLLTLPEGVIAASDHFAAVLDPVTGFTDERWQGPGGDVHLNTAGNARLAQATDTLVPDPPIPPPAGPYDSGLRDISSLVTAGTPSWARAHRSGTTVDLYLNNLDLTGVPANTTILTLPQGWRPLHTRRLVSSSSTGYPYIGTNGELKYNGTVGSVVISGTWFTSPAVPTSPLGDPA